MCKQSIWWLIAPPFSYTFVFSFSFVWACSNFWAFDLGNFVVWIRRRALFPEPALEFLRRRGNCDNSWRFIYREINGASVSLRKLALPLSFPNQKSVHPLLWIQILITNVYFFAIFTDSNKISPRGAWAIYQREERVFFGEKFLPAIFREWRIYFHRILPLIIGHI